MQNLQKKSILIIASLIFAFLFLFLPVAPNPTKALTSEILLSYQENGDFDQIQQAIQDKIDTSTALYALIYDIEIGKITIADSIAFGQLHFFDKLTGEAIIGDPGYVLIVKNETWKAILPDDPEWNSILLQAPETLVTNELRDYLMTSSTGDETRQDRAYGGYFLPWEGGIPRTLSRSISHTGLGHYAYDFYDATDRYFVVTAARPGTVWLAKWDIPRNGGSCAEPNTVNYLVILNDIGLYDLYLHLDHESIPVKFRTRGEPVLQGEKIAIADATGCTDPVDASHLHFMAHTTSNSYWGQSVDISFLDVTNCGGQPRTYTEEPSCGKSTYTSGNDFDTTPPVTTASLSGTLGENGYYISNVTATLTATDDLSGIKSTHYNLNDTGWKDYIPPSLIVTTNGRNVLQYYSVDNTNHTEATKSTAPFYIDTVLPTNPTSITTGCSITSGVWQNTCNDLYFTWSGASDATSGVTSYGYDWSGGGSGVNNITYWNPQPVSDGTYTFKLQTKDVAGNWSNWKTMFTLKYDATSPTGSIQVKNGWEVTNQALVTLNTAATDNASGVSLMRLRDGGGTWTEWLPYSLSTQWILPPQTGLTHIVEVQYLDKAGNVSPVYSDAILLDIYPDHPSSQNFQMIKSTFGMSGTDASSENFSLQGTLSQESANGFSGSENYRAISGYWGWTPKWIEFFLNFLPLMMN